MNRTMFLGFCVGVALVVGNATMEVTNRQTFDSARQAELRSKMTKGQSVENAIVHQHLERLLKDIQSGEHQKRGWN